jgi:hypothetical protein
MQHATDAWGHYWRGGQAWVRVSPTSLAAGLALHVADKRVRYAMSTRRPTCEPEHLAIQFTSVPHALNTSDRLFCTTCKRKNRGTQSTRAAGDDT